jgi:hypothetical protein
VTEYFTSFRIGTPTEIWLRHESRQKKKGKLMKTVQNTEILVQKYRVRIGAGYSVRQCLWYSHDDVDVI